MRGSSALRTSVAPGGALAGPWVRDPLWNAARAVPSLDLPFADNKSLTDSATGASLVTHTRASSGTFVGSDGVLRTAVTNLLTFSEQFDNTAWSNNNSSEQADASVAPNGTTTADKLIENSTTNVHGFARGGGSESLVTGLVYAFSVYAKAAERSFIYLQATSNFAKTYFNLSTGTVSATGSGHTPSIVAVGNGWYRCAITFTSDTTNNSIRAIGMAAASGTESYLGDGTSGLFLWGAQLEQSSTVGEYIPTTSTINSAPRFDHNPTTGESLGLMVEEQRTNLVQQSADISNAYWVKAETTVTANAIAAPDGTTTAGKLIESTANSQHTLASAAITWAGNTQYTFTFYAKAGERSKFDLLFGTAGNWVNSERTIAFDLSTGTLISVPNSPLLASITPAGNGWYRCRMTATTVASPTASAAFIRMYDNANASSYTGTAGYGLYFWGAQLEAGAFPTSYIPTTTATVTRAADVPSITGSNFSSWYNQTEGTVFSAFSIPTSSTTSGARVYSISNSGATTQAWLRLQVGTNRVYEVTDSSTQQAVLSAGTFSAGVLYRGAVALKTNDFGFSENGSTPTVDNSGTLGTVDRMGIGIDLSGIVPLNGHIRRLTYWPTRLSNEVLQRITQ